MLRLVLLSILLGLVASELCYWNRECAYQLYSSKTPYETIRGDIRDFPLLEGCEAISIWTLNRHGNRNPGNSVTENVKAIVALKDDIIESFDAGTSQLCAQDIDLFRKWTWNETLEVSQSFLTGIGYEELFDIAQRIRQRYPHLIQGDDEGSVYFRPTNEQRTVTSAMAFIHGLTEGTGLEFPMDGPYERDDVVRPYQNCIRYQQEVRGTSTLVDDQIAAFQRSNEYISVQNAVQRRLGISYQLSPDEIYYLYEICRFDRSWNERHQSPWCSMFSEEDLLILEYRDDIRHYYRNGYGHWTNPMLGALPLKDLYDNMLAAVEGRGRNITSYFTHDTMLEMTFAAMGLYRDPFTLVGESRDALRLWRSSYIGAFSTNIIAVLNRCEESGTETHKVELFINEKENAVCPTTGCPWDEFQAKFQDFSSANLDFCSLDYPSPVPETGSATSIQSLLSVILLSQVFRHLFL